jgi:two-component system sensor histidine kinase HupT/HoxJ
LVAGVAHELNKPISFVLGNVVALKRYGDRIGTYLDAVHSHGADAARLRQELRIDSILKDLPSLIEGTVEGAERTRDVVDGLKRFSAMDRNEREHFDLVPVIERAVHWVSRAAAEKFRIDLELPAALPVEGSSGQLQQVVMNLVQNAADATAGQDEPRLLITGRMEDGRILIDFQDNGSGIAPENLARIFDPFFTTKPVGQGTGLGLAISYGIVERHGGKLSADNGPQGGAVFRLALPAQAK